MTSFLTIFTRALSPAVALIATLGLASPTQAAESDWAHNEGGRMRLVLSASAEPGRFDGVLRIEPKPGWITYWREPGDSGIPPTITVAPGAPLTLERMDFPVPKRIDTGPVRDVGYDAAVSLPLTFRGSADAAGQTLTARAFIGLCKNICIPFQADLTLEIPDRADQADAMLVAQARALLPEPPSGGFKVEAARRSAGNDRLEIDLVVPDADKAAPQVFVTGPAGIVFMEFETKARTAETLSLSMPISKLPAAGDPKGETWRLLAISGGRAMETPLAFD